MKVWTLWYGGPSYRPGEYADIETFPSLARALDNFAGRADNRDGSTPCVDESELWIWTDEPEDDGNLYPARIATIGPRGGVRLQSA